MDNPFVSIIVPCYNVAPYIKQCVDSVLSQTYRHFELILVDDGSTDHTVTLIREIHDERVVLHINEDNQGASFSRNKGISLARGDWISFLDADDWWDSDRLAVLLDYANGVSANFIADDLYYILDGATKPYGTEATSKKINNQECILLSSPYLIEMELGMQPMIRRDLVKSVSARFDEQLKYGEDTYFYLQCLESPEIRAFLVTKPFYYYRVRQGSLMTNRLESISGVMKVTCEMKKRFHSNNELVEALKRRENKLKQLYQYTELAMLLKQKKWIAGALWFMRKPELWKITLSRIPKVMNYRIRKMMNKSKPV